MKNIKTFEKFDLFNDNTQKIEIGNTIYKKPYTLKIIKIIRHNYIVGEIINIDNQAKNSRHLNIGDKSFFVIDNAQLPF